MARAQVRSRPAASGGAAASLHLACLHDLLDLGDGLAGVEALGAHRGAVHDGVAAVQLVLVVHLWCNMRVVGGRASWEGGGVCTASMLQAANMAERQGRAGQVQGGAGRWPHAPGARAPR